MDEKEYRSAYHAMNSVRCVFEKAINSRVCNCSESVRFNLADREGVACKQITAQRRCNDLLQSLRDNSRFVLQLTMTDEALPHNAEIKIQNGGIKGLVKVLNISGETEDDIFRLIEAAITQYDCIDAFPYQKIVREISAYQSRRRRKADR